MIKKTLYATLKKRGDKMALSKKNNEQISFDELEFEAEYSEQREIKYLTISGKEQEYEPTWEKYTLRDLDVGETMEGRVEIVHYQNDDKKYDALRVRILDDGEILDLYVNIPKPNENGHIENIWKGRTVSDESRTEQNISLCRLAKLAQKNQ